MKDALELGIDQKFKTFELKSSAQCLVTVE